MPVRESCRPAGQRPGYHPVSTLSTGGFWQSLQWIAITRRRSTLRDPSRNHRGAGLNLHFPLANNVCKSALAPEPEWPESGVFPASASGAAVDCGLNLARPIFESLKAELCQKEGSDQASTPSSGSLSDNQPMSASGLSDPPRWRRHQRLIGASSAKVLRWIPAPRGAISSERQR